LLRHEKGCKECVDRVGED